jgi:hypothetical protein
LVELPAATIDGYVTGEAEHVNHAGSPWNRHGSHENTEDTKLMGAQEQGSVSFDFVAFSIGLGCLDVLSVGEDRVVGDAR